MRVKATLQKNSADGLRSRRDRETHRGSEKHTEAELKESAKGSARANRAMCATQQEINASCEPCVVRTRRSTGGMSVAVSVILLPEASHGTLPKIGIVVFSPPSGRMTRLVSACFCRIAILGSRAGAECRRSGPTRKHFDLK